MYKIVRFTFDENHDNHKVIKRELTLEREILARVREMTLERKAFWLMAIH